MQNETHTLRYSNEPEQDYIFHMTDWRIHRRSVPAEFATASACDIYFLEYVDSTGTEHHLVVENLVMTEGGPFIFEYQMDLVSTDGKITGTMRMTTPSQTELCRFTWEFNLTVNGTINLSSTAEHELMFAHMKRKGQPILFRKFSYSLSKFAYCCWEVSRCNNPYLDGSE